MAAKRINNRKKSVDVDVCHGLPDLIEPGEYQWQVTRVEITSRFKNAQKLYLHGVIMPGFPSSGVELFMACTMSKKPGIRSKFLESWIVAHWDKRPARKDRLSTRIFKDAIFKVMVRTVSKDEMGIVKRAALQYSIVDRLIERVA